MSQTYPGNSTPKWHVSAEVLQLSTLAYGSPPAEALSTVSYGAYPRMLEFVKYTAGLIPGNSSVSDIRDSKNQLQNVIDMGSKQYLH
jgi:hypothetical protein